VTELILHGSRVAGHGLGLWLKWQRACLARIAGQKNQSGAFSGNLPNVYLEFIACSLHTGLL
jgi:hypothetical protein